MKCNKCNSENNDSAKFCHICGAKLETPKTTKKSFLNLPSPLMDRQQLIITILAIIAIILAGVVLSYTNILAPQPTLQTKDFGAFAISIPEGSNFVLEDQITQQPGNLYQGYMNKGKWGYQISTISIFESKNNVELGELIEDNGNQKIYLNKSDAIDTYILIEDKGECSIMLIGQNVDLLKKMAETFEIKDLDSIRKNGTVPSSSSPTPSSGSSGSIQILGGSFSTGSGDEDKTYAQINVGTQHAGETYIVQIYYSRDGNGLNNGNMVPVTVHSDGYIYVTSAEAYSFYPDYATINIYDTEYNLLATESVVLSPTSGTQTF